MITICQLSIRSLAIEAAIICSCYAAAEHGFISRLSTRLRHENEVFIIQEVKRANLRELDALEVSGRLPYNFVKAINILLMLATQSTIAHLQNQQMIIPQLLT